MAKFDAKSFNPQAFGKYVERIPKTRKNELIKSGVLKGNQEIKNAFSTQTGTAYAVLPMYGRIGGAVQNYDGETDMTEQTSTTYERGVVVVGRMGAWVEKDFSTDITGGVDFMDNVAAQVSEYFEDVDQDTLLAILKGIFAMTGAKNLEFVNNHTLDITGEEGEKVKLQLKILNYQIKEEDEDIINLLIERHTSQIKYICGLQELIKPLEYIIVDKVCADFLKNKIAFGEDIGTIISTNATSIKIGDVTVDFPENSSNEAKINLILEKLERKDFDYSPFSKMRW